MSAHMRAFGIFALLLSGSFADRIGTSSTSKPIDLLAGGPHDAIQSSLEDGSLDAAIREALQRKQLASKQLMGIAKQVDLTPSLRLEAAEELALHIREGEDYDCSYAINLLRAPPPDTANDDIARAVLANAICADYLAKLASMGGLEQASASIGGLPWHPLVAWFRRIAFGLEQAVGSTATREREELWNLVAEGLVGLGDVAMRIEAVGPMSQYPRPMRQYLLGFGDFGQLDGHHDRPLISGLAKVAGKLTVDEAEDPRSLTLRAFELLEQLPRHFYYIPAVQRAISQEVDKHVVPQLPLGLFDFIQRATEIVDTYRDGDAY